MQYNQWTHTHEILSNAGRILLLCHDLADSDAFNAIVAFGLYLNGKDIAVRFAYPSSIPDQSFTLDLGFNLNSWKVPVEDVDLQNFDAVIVLDTGSTILLGAAEYLINMAKDLEKPVICIDHHQTNDLFGDINIIDFKMAACCELLYHLFKSENAIITPNMAHALLAGIFGDTNMLRTAHVTPRTLRTTADLIELGADRTALLEGMPIMASPDAARAWGRLLSEARYLLPIAYTVVDRKTYEQFDYNRLSGAVSLMRDIGGVEIAVMFLQQTPDRIRVEFRSSSRYDVSAIALSLGGGGHHGAAGCQFRDIPMDDVIDIVLAAVDRAI